MSAGAGFPVRFWWRHLRSTHANKMLFVYLFVAGVGSTFHINSIIRVLSRVSPFSLFANELWVLALMK